MGETTDGGLTDKSGRKYYTGKDEITIAADPVVQYMRIEDINKAVNRTRKNMEKAVKELDFVEAARLRDELFELQKVLKERQK